MITKSKTKQKNRIKEYFLASFFKTKKKFQGALSRIKADLIEQ